MYGFEITVKNRCKQVAQDFQKGSLDRTWRPDFELQTVLPSCFLCKHVTTLFLNTSCLSACLPSSLLTCLPHNLPVSFINMPANLFALINLPTLLIVCYLLSGYLCIAYIRVNDTTFMRISACMAVYLPICQSASKCTCLLIF